MTYGYLAQQELPSSDTRDSLVKKLAQKNTDWLVHKGKSLLEELKSRIKAGKITKVECNDNIIPAPLSDRIIKLILEAEYDQASVYVPENSYEPYYLIQAYIKIWFEKEVFQLTLDPYRFHITYEENKEGHVPRNSPIMISFSYRSNGCTELFSDLEPYYLK